MPVAIQKPFLLRLVAAAAALFIAACSIQTTTIGSEQEIAWPPAPAPAYISYLGSFRTPADLGIKKSFWQHLGDWLGGVSENRLIRPMAVASADHGNLLLVTDPGARGIHRFDLATGQYTFLQRKKRQPLPSPVGIAIAEDGTVYVTDSALGAVFSLAKGEKVLKRMQLESELEQPTGVAIDPLSDNLYIVDAASHCVRIFSTNGRYLGSFGRRGTGASEFNYPTHISIDAHGLVRVTDSLNYRIQTFDLQGSYLGSFGRAGDVAGAFSRPKGLATDSAGHIYVVDAMFHAFQIFDEQGALLLFIGDQGQAPGQFWLPTGIFISSDDTIYITDSHNQRVQMFRYSGGQS
ncbi:6-bladed beta-propeller [Thiohalobacter sp. IOR34]|uniref:6-bladed beta-propeller n=1 Tax=Thiohalobacter sp. IOR34 TaxID=3057176 RepID=UPI0025B24001|nr:6-bladed beta-propeller [Thiohalobacter sp. IOR34]WJW76620.1 6-bladed beta-propeller [Thiohalobacter sp. IOR34]